MSQRWGAFSVIDHKDAAALAADVLLYDRLLLPVPPNESERQRWKNERWDPDLQDRRLEVLGDIAEPMKWDESRQQAYSKEMEKLRSEGKRVNGFLRTAIQLAKEKEEVERGQVVAEPGSIQNVNVVPAYHSGKAFHGDFPVESDANKQAFLGHLLGQRFAVPKGDPEEALKKSVNLAKLPEFQEHRLSMYEWQQKMIDKKVSPEEAIEQMDAMLSKYNACVEKAVRDVYYKFGFTVFGIVLSMTAATANPLAAGGALVTMVRFAKLETKPAISPGLNGPAAMFHDFQNAQKSFWDWTKHS